MQSIQNPMRRAAIDPAHLQRLGGGGLSRRDPARHQLFRQIRAARRVFFVLLFTPVAALIQTVLLMLPGEAKAGFARFYWRTLARMIGLQVRVVGTKLADGGVAAPVAGEQEGRLRPVIFVANHSSWLDILAIGGELRACFVSKDDVASWPIVGTIARLGRSVFVSRSRQSIGRERSAMQERLAAGNNLILFPEGTSSDGSRVLPFHSSFFAAAYGSNDGAAESGSSVPVIQPVSIVYDRLAGLPVGRASRAVFAWYGDMSLAPHVWQLAQWRGKRVTLLFHEPIDPLVVGDRKALSQAAWLAVAEGASSLRQNRPAHPSNDAQTAFAGPAGRGVPAAGGKPCVAVASAVA